MLWDAHTDKSQKPLCPMTWCTSMALVTSTFTSLKLSSYPRSFTLLDAYSPTYFVSACKVGSIVATTYATLRKYQLPPLNPVFHTAGKYMNNDALNTCNSKKVEAAHISVAVRRDLEGTRASVTFCSLSLTTNRLR
jgi:hypothetical protein